MFCMKILFLPFCFTIFILIKSDIGLLHLTYHSQNRNSQDLDFWKRNKSLFEPMFPQARFVVKYLQPSSILAMISLINHKGFMSFIDLLQENVKLNF